MRLLEHLLAHDPATPRLTVYEIDRDVRLDFSAQTLDNWAAKVANLLRDELDLNPGDAVSIQLPVGWQGVAIALGCIAASVDFHFGPHEDATVAFVGFGAPAELFDAQAVVVTRDPFGRGVEELGETLPADAIDFGPTVRFFGDAFFEPGPSLPEFCAANAAAANPSRVLIQGWETTEDFQRDVLLPLAAGGSVVVVSGGAEGAELERIAAAEHAVLG